MAVVHVEGVPSGRLLLVADHSSHLGSLELFLRVLQQAAGCNASPATVDRELGWVAARTVQNTEPAFAAGGMLPSESIVYPSCCKARLLVACVWCSLFAAMWHTRSGPCMCGVYFSCTRGAGQPRPGACPLWWRPSASWVLCSLLCWRIGCWL